MNVHRIVSATQSDFRQSPRFDDLAVGEQIVVWAIRVLMDDHLPLPVKEALIGEAFLQMGAFQAASAFLEFMDLARELSKRPLVTGAEFVSRGELDLLRAAGPMLRENQFDI